jgi:hypothetical protein
MTNLIAAFRNFANPPEEDQVECTFNLSEITGYYTSTGVRILPRDGTVESALASRQRKSGLISGRANTSTQRKSNAGIKNHGSDTYTPSLRLHGAVISFHSAAFSLV